MTTTTNQTERTSNHIKNTLDSALTNIQTATTHLENALQAAHRLHAAHHTANREECIHTPHNALKEHIRDAQVFIAAVAARLQTAQSNAETIDKRLGNTTL